MRRHFLAVGVGDFDAVPKDTVEHHPQGGMSYCSESSCWYWVSQAPASRSRVRGFIQFCVDTIAEQTPFSEVLRGLVDE